MGRVEKFPSDSPPINKTVLEIKDRKMIKDVFFKVSCLGLENGLGPIWLSPSLRPNT